MLTSTGKVGPAFRISAPSHKEEMEKKAKKRWKREDDEWWRDSVTAMVVVVDWWCAVHAWCFLTQPIEKLRSKDNMALEYDDIYA